MADDEERIRRKAYELWLAEGCPEGRHEFHWEEAREIVALEDAGGPPTVSLEDSLEEPAEPAVAFENQGEVPGLTDQGENPAGPEMANLDHADDKPLTVEDDAPRPARRRSKAAGESAPAAAPRRKAAAAATGEAAPAKQGRAKPAAEPSSPEETPAPRRRGSRRPNGVAAETT